MTRTARRRGRERAAIRPRSARFALVALLRGVPLVPHVRLPAPKVTSIWVLWARIRGRRQPFQRRQRRCGRWSRAGHRLFRVVDYAVVEDCEVLINLYVVDGHCLGRVA